MSKLIATPERTTANLHAEAVLVRRGGKLYTVALEDVNLDDYLFCVNIERIKFVGSDNPSWAFPQFKKF